MLDWSENPLVAMYFAALQHPDDDGCIWALQPNGLNSSLVDLDGLVMMGNPSAEKIAENAFTGNGWPEVIVVAIDGQEIDPRMLAQMSRFTIHSDSTPLEMVPESGNWLRQFVIPKDAKARISAQLQAFGIRRSNLFPDLANLATELKSSSFG